MTRKTRLFVGISVGVLIIGAAAGLVASYYGFQGFSLTRDDGPAELTYLPQDSTVVAFANVRDVMNSDLRRRLMQARPEGQDPTSEFETRTGINIERDVESVVASFAGGIGQGRPLVVARGNFDEARIETLVRGQGAAVEEYKGERLFVIRDIDSAEPAPTAPAPAAPNPAEPTPLEPPDASVEPRRNMPLAISFVEPGVLAIGSLDGVRGAIDTKAQAVNVTDDAEMMNLVRDMDQGTAWAVGRFDSAMQSRLPDEVASRLPPISTFALTSRINGGVEAMVRAEAATDQGAQDLRQVVQGFMALARLQAGQNPQFTTLLNSLQVGGQGRTVNISFSVPSELIDVLSAANAQNRRETPAETPRP